MSLILIFIILLLFIILLDYSFFHRCHILFTVPSSVNSIALLQLNHWVYGLLAFNRIYPRTIHLYLQNLTYLCDVRMSVLPDSRTRDKVSHSSLRALGSMPVLGSSRNIMEGSPTRATAVLNLRLLPPLQKQT